MPSEPSPYYSLILEFMLPESIPMTYTIHSMSKKVFIESFIPKTIRIGNEWFGAFGLNCPHFPSCHIVHLIAKNDLEFIIVTIDPLWFPKL